MSSRLDVLRKTVDRRIEKANTEPDEYVYLLLEATAPSRKKVRPKLESSGKPKRSTETRIRRGKASCTSSGVATQSTSSVPPTMASVSRLKLPNRQDRPWTAQSRPA